MVHLYLVMNLLYFANQGAFAVRPGSYTKVPVKYRPVSGGDHSATLELVEEGTDRVILKATLKGRCI